MFASRDPVVSSNLEPGMTPTELRNFPYKRATVVFPVKFCQSQHSTRSGHNLQGLACARIAQQRTAEPLGLEVCVLTHDGVNLRLDGEKLLLDILEADHRHEFVEDLALCTLQLLQLFPLELGSARCGLLFVRGLLPFRFARLFVSPSCFLLFPPFDSLLQRLDLGTALLDCLLLLLLLRFVFQTTPLEVEIIFDILELLLVCFLAGQTLFLHLEISPGATLDLLVFLDALGAGCILLAARNSPLVLPRADCLHGFCAFDFRMVAYSVTSSFADMSLASEALATKTA